MRPVDRDGHLADGYSAVAQANTDSMVCDRHRMSPVAVDPGILECGSSADYAVACWPAASQGVVLCDRDPFARQLVQIPVRFVTATASATSPPAPFGLELDNGEQCKIRVGGAWASPQQEPSWVGYYACGRGEAVFAPLDAAATHGIDKSGGAWTVTVGSDNGPLVQHRVVSARFVGTAGA